MSEKFGSLATKFLQTPSNFLRALEIIAHFVILYFIFVGESRRQNFGGGVDSIERRVGAEKRLIRDLMKDYDKYARPRLSINHPVTVLVDLIVIQFEDLASIIFPCQNTVYIIKILSAIKKLKFSKT